MSKLYIFGIGGTGARVLKSLTMLLAAGVDCGVDTIVPIIIDRDESNGDFSKTKLLIENYLAVNEIALKTEINKFFKTKIKLLGNELLLKLSDNTQKFDKFIGKTTMSDENKALVDMLFSEKIQDLDMTQGFRGNPNIGSVVLNQFDDSDIFAAFAKSFKDGDKIFIISSIFGGTGASGFPLLRKVFHTTNQKDSKGKILDNWGLVNKAPIGAISVLPYFIVENATNTNDVNSDSTTFIDKTKAALSYYKSEDKHLDTLYYIADELTTTYKHNNGGGEQKNDSHFVELAASMAILDFVNPKKLSTNFHRKSDNTIEKTTYKEFGVSSNSSNITFDILSEESKNFLINPLSRFTLFCKYMGYHVVEEEKNGQKEKIVIRNNSIFDKYGKHQPYYRKLGKSIEVNKLDELQLAFYTWLKEMENQTRKFSPFNLESKNALDFVRNEKNIISESSWLDKGYNNWARFDNELNRQIGKLSKSLTKEQQFLEVFYKTTESLINTFKN